MQHSCDIISIKTTNVNLMVALDGRPEDYKSIGFILWGTDRINKYNVVNPSNSLDQYGGTCHPWLFGASSAKNEVNQ